METNYSVNRGRAFASGDAMILIATAVLIGMILLPMLARTTGCRVRGSRISCVNNLKMIGLSFRIYANDNNDRFPMDVPGSEGGAKEAAERGQLFRIFQVMSNELSIPKVVTCPADDRIPATNFANFNNADISYFVGLDAVDTKPEMILSGDRNIAINDQLLPGIYPLGTNNPVAWTKAIHKDAGNIGLADGSVQQVTTTGLFQQLKKTGDANRIVFPQ